MKKTVLLILTAAGLIAGETPPTCNLKLKDKGHTLEATGAGFWHLETSTDLRAWRTTGVQIHLADGARWTLRIPQAAGDPLPGMFFRATLATTNSTTSTNL